MFCCKIGKNGLNRIFFLFYLDASCCVSPPITNSFNHSAQPLTCVCYSERKEEEKEGGVGGVCATWKL